MGKGFLWGKGEGRERGGYLVFSHQDLKSKRIWFTKAQELFPECEQEGEKEWRIQDLTGPLCWDQSKKYGTTEHETVQGLILTPNPMLPPPTSTPGIYISSHRPIQTVSYLNESEGTGFLRPFTATFQLKSLILQNLRVCRVCRRSQSIENTGGLSGDKVSCPIFSIKQLQGTNPGFSAPSLSTLLPGQHVTYLISPVLNNDHYLRLPQEVKCRVLAFHRNVGWAAALCMALC